MNAILSSYASASYTRFMAKPKTPSTVERDLELLYEIGSLRNFDRQWVQHVGITCANNLEHSFRVAFLALMIARMEGVRDEASILKMALVHDLPESRVGDLGYVQKVYSSADEDRAAHDLFTGTAFADFYKETFTQYERRSGIEAKIVKDADNLDVDIELKELEERGSQLPKKLAKTRRLVRDKKLYTKSAKKVWDAIQTSNVSSWHLAANKWVKIPSAGR